MLREQEWPPKTRALLARLDAAEGPDLIQRRMSEIKSTMVDLVRQNSCSHVGDVAHHFLNVSMSDQTFAQRTYVDQFGVMMMILESAESEAREQNTTEYEASRLGRFSTPESRQDLKLRLQRLARLSQALQDLARKLPSKPPEKDTAKPVGWLARELGTPQEPPVTQVDRTPADWKGSLRQFEKRLARLQFEKTLREFSAQCPWTQDIRNNKERFDDWQRNSILYSVSFRRNNDLEACSLYLREKAGTIWVEAEFPRARNAVGRGPLIKCTALDEKSLQEFFARVVKKGTPKPPREPATPGEAAIGCIVMLLLGAGSVYLVRGLLL